MNSTHFILENMQFMEERWTDIYQNKIPKQV